MENNNETSGERADNLVSHVLEGLTSKNVDSKQKALENILYELLDQNKEQFQRLHETLQWDLPNRGQSENN